MGSSLFNFISVFRKSYKLINQDNVLKERNHIKLFVFIALLLSGTLPLPAQLLPNEAKPYFTEYSFENIDDYPDYVFLFPKLSVLAETDFAKRRVVRNEETFRLYPDETIAFEVFRKHDLDSVLVSRLRFLLKTNSMVENLDSLLSARLSQIGYTAATQDSFLVNFATVFFLIGSYKSPLEQLRAVGLDSVIVQRLLTKKSRRLHFHGATCSTNLNGISTHGTERTRKRTARNFWTQSCCIESKNPRSLKKTSLR
jgi:hypothetical protein